MSKLEQILGKDINSIKELREEIKRLQDSIAGVDPDTEEFASTTEKLAAAQEQLAAVTRKAASENNAAKDSIVGMQQEYKKLYDQYKLLTDEQRNSGMGKQMAQDLEILSDKLNKTKMGVGNFKDNIGRYTSSVMDAFKQMGVSVGGLTSPLQAATKGFSSLNTAMKANPAGMIIAAIMTLINVFKKIKESIMANEESQMRWNEAMSAFKPWIDAVKNGLDKLGKIVLKFVEGVADAVRWVRKLFKGEEGEEINKTYKELAKSQNELTKKKREYQKVSAKDKAEVEALREKASATNDAAEKQALLQEAKEKQAEIDNRQIEIAKEELRILEEQSQLTANDAEMNDKLAAAVARVSEAEAAAAANARMFNRQMGAGKTETTSTGGGGGKSKYQEEKEEAKKTYEELEEYYKSDSQKLEEKYIKDRALLIKYRMDTALLDKKYEQDKAKLDKEAAEKEKETLLNRLTQRVNFERRVRDLSIETADESKRLFLKREYAAADRDRFKEAAETIKADVDAAKAKVAEYNETIQELINSGFTFSPEHLKEGELQVWAQHFEAVKDKIGDAIEVINAELDTDIQFPPEWTPESIKKFEEQMDMIGKIFERNYANAASDAAEQLAKNIVDRFQKVTANAVLGDKYANLVEYRYAKIREFILAGDADVKKQLAEAEWDELDYQRQVIERQLEMEELVPERRKELEMELTEILIEQAERRLAYQEREAELSVKLWNDSFKATETFAQSVNTVTSAFDSLIQSEMQDKKISEAAFNKKKKQLQALQDVAITASIFQIAGSTAAGVMGVWEGYGKELALNAETAAGAGIGAAAVKAALDTKSLVSAILNTTAIIGSGVANLAAARAGYIQKSNQIKEMSFGGGEAGVAASVSPIDSTPYTFTREIQDVDENDELNKRPIVVSVVDIIDAQNKVQVRQGETSF